MTNIETPQILQEYLKSSHLWLMILTGIIIILVIMFIFQRIKYQRLIRREDELIVMLLKQLKKKNEELKRKKEELERQKTVLSGEERERVIEEVEKIKEDLERIKRGGAGIEQLKLKYWEKKKSEVEGHKGI